VKILIAGGGTGGHLVPALAIADAVRAARPDAALLLVGAIRGIEAQVLDRGPYRYVLLPFEPLYRRAWWRNARWVGRAPRLVLAVDRLLREEQPAIVVGTGGYASGPLLWRAQRRGLPTALQEQNAFPGLATRWLARRATQVHLGFPEAAARLRPGPQTQLFTFGNPVRLDGPPDRSPEARREARGTFGLDPARPCVLVFGGSQGARALNVALAGALASAHLAETSVLWATGPAHEAALRHLAVPGRVAVRGFFDPIALAYRASDLVVGRAGAMTVAEVCAWGLPSILVPLPSAAADHQAHNARALAEAGAAVWLPEESLGAERLGREIEALLRAPEPWPAAVPTPAAISCQQS